LDFARSIAGLLRWLRRAAELGDPDAKAAIAPLEEMRRSRGVARARKAEPDAAELHRRTQDSVEAILESDRAEDTAAADTESETQGVAN
jgi:hypothetical protein